MMKTRPDLWAGGAKRVHPHAWLWEPLEPDPTFVLRSMFGAKTIYLDGRLVLCFAAREEPFCGVLVCTERAHHVALQQQFGALAPHPILPKWLYLSEAAAAFEAIAEKLVRLAQQRDPRLGIVPPPRQKASRRPTSASRRRSGSA